MPTADSSLKALLLTALVAAGGAVFAQGHDQWYGGQTTGFWGLGNSVGVRGALPGMLNPPATSLESLNAPRQYGGYRFTDGFAIEGTQTHFGSSASACGGDSQSGDRSCYGAAWSLSGVATLPFQSGVSLHGRLGLQYRQRGLEDATSHRNSDDPGGIGKVYGIGLSYGLSKSITVHAESERHSDLIGNNASGPGANLGLDSSVHSIGLAIKF
ncbi:MAG TPA: outer membrane beta-barrel protein [Burkholderiales bacterium]|nr:outer membrane beta-barrel protein [Burkholderiales bacterium]